MSQFPKLAQIILVVMMGTEWAWTQGRLSLFDRVGPIYGIPHSPKAAARFPIPLSTAGKCIEGTVYNISSVADLKRHRSDLQCIWAAGLTPSKVPEGRQHNGVLTTAGTTFYNRLVTLIWRGNDVFKINCDASNTSAVNYIAFHYLTGGGAFPTLTYIEPMRQNLAPGEYEDGKPSGFMDFTLDVRANCKNYDNFLQTNKSQIPPRVVALEKFYPINQWFDGFRLVGHQADGGKIYLGKTYMQDYFRPDKQVATISFWYFINYDQEVNPDFEKQECLPPVPSTFNYIFPGLEDLIWRLSALDDFVKRPVGTLRSLTEGTTKNFRTVIRNYRELIRNIGNYRRSWRKLRQYRRQGRRSRLNLFSLF